MSWLSLLFKDLREHGVAFVTLAMGFFLVVLVALVQQSLGEFKMSSFEVIRFSLITLIPLITFIVGNRLIVREYTGGTRRFVEALPIGNFAPLLVKYFIGLVYICALCAIVVFLSASTASEAEDVSTRYLQMLLIKTITIGVLFWSVVFFVSFTGRIRLVIYVVMGLTLLYLINSPGFDQSRLAPLALMDRQLFIFERDVFPTQDCIVTLAIAMGFVLSGFGLALFNEGSIAEQLGKPISRRDMAAFGVLGLGCLTVYATLEKHWVEETYETAGSHVLRSESPEIVVSYLAPENKAQAERIMNTLQTNLIAFQADVGLATTPQVIIALNTELEHTEIEPELMGNVLLNANFTDYGDYEHGLLQSIAMHHSLLSLTNGRWDFETRHWLLDGFARWWAEGAETAKNSVLNTELFAQALLAKRRFNFDKSPLLIWQTITDQFGFEAADALSYSAILFLEEKIGKEKLVELAVDYINEEVGDSSIESVQRMFLSDESRFKKLTGLPIDKFSDEWLAWLEQYSQQPEIQALVSAVPFLNAEVMSVRDEFGAYRLEASYSLAQGQAMVGAAEEYDAQNIDGLCVLRHQRASAFDLETMIYERNRDRQPCNIEGVAHSIDSPYAPGDRVYVLLEYETEKFHRPIPLWVERVHVK